MPWDLATVVTSAVVGSVVTAVGGAVVQWRERASREKQATKDRESRETQARDERDARKRELVMKAAIDMAHAMIERQGALAKRAPVFMLEAVLARRYHGALDKLFDTGKLTPELEREHTRLELIEQQHRESRDETDARLQAAHAIWTGKASPLRRPEPSVFPTDKDDETSEQET